jgi:hypothetical protein
LLGLRKLSPFVVVVALVGERRLVVGYRPTLTFDTSGISGTGCLADEPDSEALIAGLKAGFHTRFTFTSVSEIIATTSGERRRKLLRVCDRLLHAGDCIDPQHHIIRKMVARFEEPAPFDWTEIDVRFLKAEVEIARRNDFSDELAEQEREEVRASDKTFGKVYSDAKPAFDKLFASGVEKAPGSVSELVSRLQIEGGAFWGQARNLYERAAGKPVDEAVIRRFIAACPPFRALMVALCAAQYDRCIRPQNVGPSLRSGMNDTFMSVYLPYCQRFVTNDSGQLRCLREVASICQLDVAVQSYEEFRDGLFLSRSVACSAA